MNKKTQLMLGALMMGGVLAAPSAEAVKAEVPTNSHCVAWKTNKTLGLVKRATAVGTSCKVSVKAVKKGDLLGAEVSVPISSFDSKEKKRDAEVLKILQAKKQPSVIFKTAMLSSATWTKMLSNGSGPVKGTLYIGKKAYPQNVVVKVKKAGKNVVLSGVLVTKFSKLGIKPPTVGPGGSIAKVDDYVELHFSFNSSKLQNKAAVPGL